MLGLVSVYHAWRLSRLLVWVARLFGWFDICMHGRVGGVILLFSFLGLHALRFVVTVYEAFDGRKEDFAMVVVYWESEGEERARRQIANRQRKENSLLLIYYLILPLCSKLVEVGGGRRGEVRNLVRILGLFNPVLALEISRNA